ncbi:hypothetical protein M0802_001753 [Mischocyttarus mexicanus]|nr:hypothetical protein M0802_001753 [Mischocyttarus mexicanus]
MEKRLAIWIGDEETGVEDGSIDLKTKTIYILITEETVTGDTKAAAVAAFLSINLDIRESIADVDEIVKLADQT